MTSDRQLEQMDLDARNAAPVNKHEDANDWRDKGWAWMTVLGKCSY